VIVLEAALTDAVLVMFGKLIAQYGRAAARKSDERAAASMREVQADLRVFALSGRAMLKAKSRDGDLNDAVAAGVGWSRFEAAVARAEALSAPEALDPTADLVARHASVKQFGPAMLSALAFEGGQGLDGRTRGDPRHLRGLDPTLTLVANSSAAMRHEPLRGSEPRSANIAWRLGACPPTMR
jgi:hypothetical protein